MVIVIAILIYFYYTSLFSIETDQTDILFEYPNFLTDEECDMLIEISQNRLEPSKVYDSQQDNNDQSQRKSDQCWLHDNDHPVIEKISKKAAELSGKPMCNQELLQVVKYPEGGFFNPHYDACVGNKEYCKRMNGVGGPRYMTLLIYLNDDFSGGETSFPKLNKTAQPQKGKAIVFYNTDQHGKVLNNSMHGGNPVQNGNKWICNKWVRINEYVNP